MLGYEVTYRYGGREYTTRMDHDPGERMRVRVDTDYTDHAGRLNRIPLTRETGPKGPAFFVTNSIRLNSGMIGSLRTRTVVAA